MKPVILILILAFSSAVLSAQTAEEIVRRTDDSMHYDTAYMEARMLNSDQFGTKTINYRAWAKGSNFLMEFTSPAEYGQKILRTDDRIYHFFPESESLFTRSRGDSVVGLISYDDLTDDSALLDTYNVRLEGEELMGGIPCYRILMEVRQGKRAAYPVQRIWIRKDAFSIQRAEMFTRSGTPLKTLEIRKTGLFDGKQMAVDILITDEVRRGVASEIFIDRVILNRDVDDRMFTRRELTR